MNSFLIQGATVVDGSGREPFRADVTIAGDRIAAVAPRIDEPAERRLKGDGLVIAPGFIDIHSHTDATVFTYPLVESKVMQGVTAEVIGNCGIGAFPVNAERREILAGFLKVHDFVLPAGGLSWVEFDDYAARLDRLGLGPNLIALVSHGALRIAAMGAEDRLPTPDELGRMQELLARALEQGAWGMSTGLIYPPGSFAETEELVALAKVLRRYDALYTSHIRGEGATLMTAIDEAIRIGREGGVRVEISHLKAMGKDNWGRGPEALQRLEAARREGVDISADQYPYEATSTSLSALVPAWAHAGGLGELLRRLAVPDLTARLEAGIGEEMNIRGGPNRIFIGSIASSRNGKLSGKNLEEIAALWDCRPEGAVIRLLREEEGAVGAIYFSLSDEDVAAILANDQVAVGSDGRGLSAAGDTGESIHPRSYGTFARVLGLYVRKRGLLSLAQAVHKMTALPAGRLGLRERGVLKPGWMADLVVFDPDVIEDLAQFSNPHLYAAGIVHLFVNGRPLVANGQITGERPGRVLRKKRA
jgi:N-acyl-D-amino-acid deacylase